ACLARGVRSLAGALVPRSLLRARLGAFARARVARGCRERPRPRAAARARAAGAGEGSLAPAEAEADMRFWLLGLAVVLAVHVLATSTASLLVAARYGRARGWLAALPPAERARRLL